jgi:hypothetical protein
VAKDEASVYEGGATRPWFKSTGRPTSGPLAAWNLIGLLTPKPGSGPCSIGTASAGYAWVLWGAAISAGERIDVHSG